MKEIKYDKYYWQNNLVRLRPWSEDDWEWDYINGFDSEGCRLDRSAWFAIYKA